MRQAFLSISALLLLLSAAALAGPAASQTPDPGAPVPVEGPAAGGEAVPAGSASPAAAQPGGGEPPAAAVAPRSLRPYWHVFAAFAVAWILLLGYVVSLGRRIGRLDDEVRRLSGVPE